MEGTRKRQWLKMISAALTITMLMTAFPGMPTLAQEVQNAISSDQNTELLESGEVVQLKPGDMTQQELQTAVLKEDEIPEIIEREQLEQNKSVNRLYEQETDMTSVLYQNRDGSKTLYIFDRPVKYKDTDGKIKDKKNSLSGSIKKLEYKLDYQYVNQDNDIKTYFPKKLNGNKSVITELGEHTLAIKPVSTAQTSKKALHPILAAPQPSAQKKALTQDGIMQDVVEYPGVFGSDTVLRYTPTFNGVKEDIILKQNPGQNTFSFELDIGDLEARLQENQVEIWDPKTEETVFLLSPIYVYDSGEQVHSTVNNQYTLKKLDKPGKYQVTLVVDEEFLNADSTVYPVYVDPTVTADGVNAFDHTVLYSKGNYPAGTKFYDLHVGDTDKAYPNYFHERGVARSLLRLNALLYNQNYINLPINNIRSVQLALYDVGQETSESTIGVYPFKSAWDPDTASYSNTNWGNYQYNYGTTQIVGGNPPKGTKLDGTKGSASENHWYIYSLYTMARLWKEGQYGGLSLTKNGGVLLKASNESLPARTFTSPQPPLHGDYNSPRIIMNFVEVRVTGVYATKDTIKLKKGTSEYIQANVLPTNADNKALKYRSADPSIATVDANGKVTAVGNGTTTITVSSAENSSIDDTVKVVSGNKAIIILPGIMGSEMYAKEKITIDSDHPLLAGKKLWDPDGTDIASGDAPWQVQALQCTLKGSSFFDIGVNAPTINNRNQDSYGVQNTYAKLYQVLYGFYYPEYDIVLYEYDWRFDPKETAQQLNTFIEEQGYFDLIFVSHSMGGLVSSHYLNIGAEQRANVDKHISLGTPYLGSLLPFPILDTGEFLDAPGLKGIFVELIGNTALKDAVKDISPNITGIYSLMPPNQHWRSYLHINQLVATYQETMDAFNDFYPHWNTALLNKAQQSNNELFINGRHITDYVDSYYIVGVGEETIQKIVLSGNSLSTVKSKEGDGTVPLWSATIGETTPADKTFYKYSIVGLTTALHGNLAKGTRPIKVFGVEVEDTTTFSLITLIINEYIDNYSEDTLYDRFGVKKTKPTATDLRKLKDASKEQTEYVFDKEAPATIQNKEG